MKRVTWLSALLFSMLTHAFARAAPTKDQCVDAFARAQDLRRDHQLRSSREAFLLCAEAACPKLMRKECVSGLDQLSTAQPSVVFQVKSRAGQDLSEVSVTIDGALLAARLDGSPIAIDPGAHTFELRAEGLPPATLQLVIREGERGRLEPVVLGPAPASEEPVARPGPPPSSPSQAATPPELSVQRKVALVIGGVGVAAAAVGGVFGVLTVNRKHDAKLKCPSLCQDQTGVDAWSSAKVAGNVSTFSFVAAGAALATSGVLWLTAKPATEDQGRVAWGVGPTSVQLRWKW